MRMMNRAIEDASDFQDMMRRIEGQSSSLKNEAFRAQLNTGPEPQPEPVVGFGSGNRQERRAQEKIARRLAKRNKAAA